MPLVAICIVLYFAIYLFDLRLLIKKKEKKSLFFYIPIFLITFVINILFELGVDIPSPAGPIKDLVNLIFGLQ